MANGMKVKLEVRYKGNKSGSTEKFIVQEKPASFKEKFDESLASRSGVLRFLEEGGSEVVLILGNILRIKIRTESKPKRKGKKRIKKEDNTAAE